MIERRKTMSEETKKRNEEIAARVRAYENEVLPCLGTKLFVNHSKKTGEVTSISCGGMDKNAGVSAKLSTWADSGNPFIEVGIKQADGSWKNVRINLGGKQLEAQGIIAKALYENRVTKTGTQTPADDVF